MGGVAAVYVRVSTAEQAKKGLSLKEQARVLSELAEREGFAPLVYEEAGRSASAETLERRPEMQRLLRDAEAGKVARVLVEDWSRLSRNDAVGAEISRRLESAGVFVQTPAGVFDPSEPESALGADVLKAVAKFQSRMQAKKSKATRHRAASEGYWPSGPPPFGYRIVADGNRKRLAPDERESAAVRRMFELAATGISPQKVCEALNADEVMRPRRAQHWGHVLLRRMLRQEAYATGKLVWGPYAIPLEPLISQALFKRVQDALDRRATGPGASLRRHDYLVAGHLYCGACGRTYYGRHASEARLLYYWCGSQHSTWAGPKCAARKFRADKLDSQVWDAVRGLLADPGQLEEAVVRAFPLVTEDSAPKVAALERKLADLEDERERVQRRETDDTRAARLVGKIDAERLKAENELARLRTRAALEGRGRVYVTRVAAAAEAARANLDRATFEERRALIEALNLRIIVPQDRDAPLTLELALPIKPGRVEADGEIVGEYRLPRLADWQVQVLDEMAFPVGLIQSDTGLFQNIFDKVVALFN